MATFVEASRGQANDEKNFEGRLDSPTRVRYFIRVFVG